MDRRSALSLLGKGVFAGCTGSVLTACGGGGSAGGVATASTLASGSLPRVQPLSADIACWGDSITQAYAGYMGAYFPGRQVFNGGVSGETSQQIRARQVADGARRASVTIFWYGHNNFDKDEVKADLAASVAALAPGNGAYVVLSMLTWADAAHAAETPATLRVNAELAALYPNNFIDMRGHLMDLAGGRSAQDAQDVRDGHIPSSLRSDAIHLNDAGCNAVCRRISAYFAERGW